MDPKLSEYNQLMFRKVVSANKPLRSSSDTEGVVPRHQRFRNSNFHSLARNLGNTNLERHERLQTQTLEQNSQANLRSQTDMDNYPMRPSFRRQKDLYDQNLVLREQNNKYQQMMQHLIAIIDKQKVSENRVQRYKNQSQQATRSISMPDEYNLLNISPKKQRSQPDLQKNTELGRPKQSDFTTSKLMRYRDLKKVSMSAVPQKELLKARNVSEWQTIPDKPLIPGRSITSNDSSPRQASKQTIPVQMNPQHQMKNQHRVYFQRNDTEPEEFLFSFGIQNNNEKIKKFNLKIPPFPRDVFMGNVQKTKKLMSKYRESELKLL